MQIERNVDKKLARKINVRIQKLALMMSNTMKCVKLAELRWSIEKSLAECDASGIGETVRAIWRSDIENLRWTFKKIKSETVDS